MRMSVIFFQKKRSETYEAENVLFFLLSKYLFAAIPIAAANKRITPSSIGQAGSSGLQPGSPGCAIPITGISKTIETKNSEKKNFEVFISAYSVQK